MPGATDMAEGILNSVLSACQNVPKEVALKMPKIIELKAKTKELKNQDSAASKLLDRYKTAKKDELPKKNTIAGKISVLTNLLDEAHTKLNDEEAKVGGVWGIAKAFVKCGIEKAGYGDWISYIPQAKKSLEQCKTSLEKTEKSLDKLIEECQGMYEEKEIVEKGKKVTKRGLSPENAIYFRNRFRDDIIPKLQSECSQLQTFFAIYASHKFGDLKKSDKDKSEEDPINLVPTQQVLSAYIRILAGYAGIKAPNKQKDLFKSRRPEVVKHGDDYANFGHGIVAAMIASIYEQMMGKASKELKRLDEKDIWESSLK